MILLLNYKRIAAGAVAVAVLAGSIGVVALHSNGVAETEAVAQTGELPIADYGYEYGIMQNLYFKINELWRLGINSDLDREIVSAVSALNSGFNGELLMEAIKAEGSEVVDEYIYSVLAGLDFNLYLSDKEAYDKAKAEAIYTGEILTEDKINDYLNQLNEETAKAQVNEALNSAPTVEVPTPGGPGSITPPTAESVMPENPADAIRRETEAITNRAMGIEVE